jgi:hypothetical protein
VAATRSRPHLILSDHAIGVIQGCKEIVGALKKRHCRSESSARRWPSDRVFCRATLKGFHASRKDGEPLEVLIERMSGIALVA